MTIVDAEGADAAEAVDMCIVGGRLLLFLDFLRVRVSVYVRLCEFIFSLDLGLLDTRIIQIKIPIILIILWIQGIGVCVFDKKHG